jgi:hypothetical protein
MENVDGFKTTKFRRQRHDSDLAALLRQHFDLAINPVPEVNVAPASRTNLSCFYSDYGFMEIYAGVPVVLGLWRETPVA